MAQTPFSDIKSEDILSAHVSGIQHAVNKIESVLNMKTVAVTGHTLNAVADQDDAGLHRYVYEGTIRNWLLSPAPVIKRNGTTVASSEYTLKAPYGAIVFNAQQASGDVITADFTYVTNDSTVIDDLTADVSAVESDVTALDSRVTTLEVSGGGGSGGGTPESNGYFDIAKNCYTNIKPSLGQGVSYRGAAAVTVTANRIDAFPIIIKSAVTLSKIRVVFNSGSPTCNNYVGIYSNKSGDIAPDTLLAQSAMYRHGTVAQEDVSIPLTAPITLQPGTYWLARWSNDNAKLDGQTFNPGLHIAINAPENKSSGTTGQKASTAVGVRTGTAGLSGITSLPTTFPAVGTADTTDTKYLIRDDFGLLEGLV